VLVTKFDQCLLLVTQVVNDTNPTFYYCGTPTHCEKGMFGIINPPNAFGQPGSAAMMMPTLASQNPSTQAAMQYASNCTAGQPMAAAWGTSMDMSNMPSWAQSYAAENIMYTQSFLAMNPEVISNNGVDLAPLASNSIMIPTDVASAVRASTGYGSSTDSSSSAAASPSSSSTSNSAASKGGSNGAGALSSPRVAVALVAVAAVFFAL
jgi:hypothetical protein